MTAAEDFRDAWESQVVGAAPTGIVGLVEFFGGGSDKAALARGRSALAVELAGTSDKGSKEYKAARRNVERYFKAEKGAGGEGRTPRLPKNVAGIAQLQDAASAKAHADAIEKVKENGLYPNVHGELEITMEDKSGQRKRYSGTRTAYPVSGDALDEDDLEGVLEAIDEGNWEDAWDAFQAVLLDAYDLPESQFVDVEYINLNAGG